MRWRNLIRRPAALAALVAMASAAGPILCRAQPSTAGSSFNRGDNGSAVEKYWTAERMRSAKPLELHPGREIPAPLRSPAANAPPVGGSGSPPQNQEPPGAEASPN